MFGKLYFPNESTLTATLAAFGTSASSQYGPEAALIAEAFAPRLRYSGPSLGYQLASVIAGGPAPLVATVLFATYHSGYAISVYIAACALVGLVSAAFMSDHTGKDISLDYDGHPIVPETSV